MYVYAQHPCTMLSKLRKDCLVAPIRRRLKRYAKGSIRSGEVTTQLNYIMVCAALADSVGFQCCFPRTTVGKRDRSTHVRMRRTTKSEVQL